MKRKNKHSRSGMTLLEVLISAAIFALFAASLGVIQGQSIDSTLLAKEMNTAAMLAQSKMTEIEQNAMETPLDELEKESEGKFEAPYADYSWKQSVREVEFPMEIIAQGLVGKEDDSQASPMEVKAMNLIGDHIKKSVREVTLEIEWKSFTGTEKISVSTYVTDLNQKISLGL